MDHVTDRRTLRSINSVEHNRTTVAISPYLVFEHVEHNGVYHGQHAGSVSEELEGPPGGVHTGYTCWHFKDGGGDLVQGTELMLRYQVEVQWQWRISEGKCRQ